MNASQTLGELIIRAFGGRYRQAERAILATLFAASLMRSKVLAPAYLAKCAKRVSSKCNISGWRGLLSIGSTLWGVPMSDITSAVRPQLDDKPHTAGPILFIVILAVGLLYTAMSITTDMKSVGEGLAISAFVLLGIALLIALGFEFVNGFHDTANAVATVIYTHSLPPLVAVVWSGSFNFLGVLTSSGAVAYTVVTLLPVELILQVGSGAGYAMIFALLIAAIVWNLATWSIGLPNSSSHALIGSIIGVGVANQLLAPDGSATSGVDWGQAIGVFKALLFSPLIGFVMSALLFLAMKYTIRVPKLYTAPEGRLPPPWPIRGLLVLTCTGVSFAHGSNDGQKGMGLIMLILIGAVPTAYALNRTMPESTTPAFLQTAQAAQNAFLAHASGSHFDAPAARSVVGEALKTKAVNTPQVYAALATLSGEISQQVKNYGAIKKVSAAATPNVRNDMYLTSDAVRLMGAKPPGFDEFSDRHPQSVSECLGCRHQVHPDLGQGGSRLGVGIGHHGGLEAHRDHGRREDRQVASDLWAGGVGRVGRHDHHRDGGSVGAAGLHDPCAIERCGRHDGRQWLGLAMGDRQEHGAGLGVDAARRDGDRRLVVCHLATGVLMMKALILVPAAH